MQTAWVNCEIVDRAASRVNLRCAVSRDEALDLVVPKTDLPRKVTVLAADGSQINPSRHARVAFCVINVGVVKMELGSGKAPEIHTQSHLLDYDALFQPGGWMISEGMVALKRDLREREALVEFAGELEPPAISMTDGPLELFQEPQESEEYNRTLDRYLEVLGRLHDLGLMTIGYVDKPGGDLVGRMLELAQISDDDLQDYRAGERSPVSDVLLFQDLRNRVTVRRSLVYSKQPCVLAKTFCLISFI